MFSDYSHCMYVCIYIFVCMHACMGAKEPLVWPGKQFQELVALAGVDTRVIVQTLSPEIAHSPR